jgi:hypothetical protein
VAGFTSGLGPLLGYWLETGRISASAEVAAIFELHLAHNRLRMRKMTVHAAAISEALAQAGVAHAFVKGMHTAFEHFPEPGTRPLSDIDVLIDPGDRKDAERVLEACGFEPGVARVLPTERAWHLRGEPRKPRTLCFVHAEDPWSIDLHVSLDRRHSPASPVVRLDRALAGTAARCSALAPRARLLPEPALLLNAAVHAGCGLENLTLLRMVELALIVRQDYSPGGASWDEFVDAAARCNALGPVYPALKFCNELVPGTIPEAVVALSRGKAPPRARRIVDGLRVAGAQRVLRCSLGERFMWSPSSWRIAWQLVQEVAPPGWRTAPQLLDIYRNRFWRLARRRLSS